MFDDVVDAAVFVGGGFEEFEARGRIEEQVFEDDLRTARRGTFSAFDHFGALDVHIRSRIGIAIARRHRHARDGGHRRECFAAESHRRNGA